MRIRISEGHRFWLGIGGAAMAVAAMLVVWALPARRAAARAERAWARQTITLNLLQSELGSGNIPSLATLEDRAAYITWLEEQTTLMKRYFAERAALLDAPITGESDVTPAEFKDAYVRVTARQREWFANNKDSLLVRDAPSAFRVYEWETAGDLPSPAEYRAVADDPQSLRRWMRCLDRRGVRHSDFRGWPMRYYSFRRRVL